MKKIYCSLYLFIFYICTFSISVKAEDCSSVLGGSLVNELQKIFDTICYAGLIIGVILGMLDFFKVIVGGDKSELKSVGAKFVKRLLAIALLFILSAIIKWLLKISGVDNGGTCIS